MELINLMSAQLEGGLWMNKPLANEIGKKKVETANGKTIEHAYAYSNELDYKKNFLEAWQELDKQVTDLAEKEGLICLHPDLFTKGYNHNGIQYGTMQSAVHPSVIYCFEINQLAKMVTLRFYFEYAAA